MNTSEILVIPVTPTSKPRMTQSDKWKGRVCVTRYWEFKDRIRKYLTEIPQPCLMVFIYPMPKSWSKKKKKLMEGEKHESTPDLDNFEKALLDSLYQNDSHIWNVHKIKIWGLNGKILIEPMEIDQILMNRIKTYL
jgi:Holliday junction resolvase RusA-like endonuclease